MNEYFPFIFPTFIFPIIVLLFIMSFGEMAVSGLWLPAYFRYGILLFRKEYPLTTMPDLAAKIPELEQKLKRSMWRPSIVFRELNENEIAFRSNFNSRNKISGLIRLEPGQGRMRISGNLYWMFLVLPFLFLLSMNIVFMVFMAAIILVNVIQQRNQYGQIAAVILATAVTAPSSTWQTPEIGGYTPQTTVFNPKSYEPILYDPQSKKPQTGLTKVEVALIIILGSLIIIACAAAFLFFSGA